MNKKCFVFALVDGCVVVLASGLSYDTAEALVANLQTDRSGCYGFRFQVDYPEYAEAFATSPAVLVERLARMQTDALMERHKSILAANR